MNKLTHHSVESLLKITFETTRFPLNWKDHKLVESVTTKFNNQLVGGRHLVIKAAHSNDAGARPRVPRDGLRTQGSCVCRHFSFSGREPE